MVMINNTFKCLYSNHSFNMVFILKLYTIGMQMVLNLPKTWFILVRDVSLEK